MNLEFNIAVHVLCFLAKQKDKHYSSTELAELTCLNPVQLRRVMSQLNNSNYIQTIRGKHGGYQANQHTAAITLAELYSQFVLDKTHTQRLFTGSIDSDCIISNQIATTMSHYREQEQQLILNFYRDKTIDDVIEDIIKEA